MAVTRSRQRPRASTPPEPPARLSLRIQAQVERGVGALGRCLERVTAILDDEGAGYDKDIASHLAWLVKNNAAVMGEVRKLEADERAAATKLNHGAVMGYLRNLPPEKRAQVMRELADMDSGRSVLA